MDLGIKNKKALVMGASSGIGKGIAKSLIEEGVEVAICARNEENLNKAAKEIGAKMAIPCDLSKPGAGKSLVEKVIRKFSELDILVTNTGGPPKGVFSDLNCDQWQEGFQSLYLSVIEAIQTALPVMKVNKWGRIVLITSISAKEPLPKLTISNGLRAGLMGLTKSLSNEIAEFGITINSILPGFTDTDRLRELGIPEEKISAQIPAKRLGKTKELGDLTAFLASERACYISGQCIAIDGGYLKSF